MAAAEPAPPTSPSHFSPLQATQLVLVRHGRTPWAAAGRHTGVTDVPLDEVGRFEAKAVGERLAGLHFDRVLTSPRSRAKETAVLAGFGERTEVRDELAEWDYGELEGRTTSDIRRDHPGWTIWRGPVPGGESPAQVGARVDAVLDRLVSSGLTVAIFSHGHLLRVLTARWLGLAPEDGRLLKLDTATISVLGYEREQRVIQSWNQPAREVTSRVTLPVILLPDAAAAARAAGAAITWELRRVVASKGRATLAVSGGSSPAAMFAELARLGLPWSAVDIVQVDERVAPPGDPARNLTTQAAELPPEARVHPMPVEDGDVAAYAPLVRELDVVHLGLGDDGHTASLLPGDPALDLAEVDVAMTGEYRGHRRMTLTYPALDRAAAIVWLVTGEAKAAVLPRLLAADRSIPAGRVASDRAIVFADRAAASDLP